MDIKEHILNLATPVVKSQGLEIWGLEILPAPRQTVRLYVDLPLEKISSQPGDACSATIDQCEEISRQLGLALEVEDIFPAAWTLEVSTPGLERKFFSLEQMRPYCGDLIDVILSEPLEGQNRKVFRGRLLSVGDDYLEIEPCSVSAEGDILPDNLPPCSIPWAKVRKAARVHVFASNPKPGKGPKKKK